MTARYALVAPARNDIRDSLLYVDERFGRLVASRVRDRSCETFERLAEHPELGHSRTEDRPQEHRFFPLGPSLVACRANA